VKFLPTKSTRKDQKLIHRFTLVQKEVSAFRLLGKEYESSRRDNPTAPLSAFSIVTQKHRSTIISIPHAHALSLFREPPQKFAPGLRDAPHSFFDVLPRPRSRNLINKVEVRRTRSRSCRRGSGEARTGVFNAVTRR